MKRKLFNLISLCILLSVLVGCAETPLIELYGLTGKTHKAVTPVHRLGWWAPRHKAVLNQVKKGNVDLILVGDSITHGWDGQKELWAKYYAPRKAVNMGFSGDRTEHVLWRLDHGEIDGISPKLAVLMIGTNNRNTTEQIADGIKAICLKMRQKLPKTKILMLAIFPRGEGPSTHREKNAKASELASQIADNKSIFYLNINDKFLDDQDILAKEIMPDRLHPNAKGYKIWAEAMEPMVAKLMGETKTEAQILDEYGLTGKTHTAVTPVRQSLKFMDGRYKNRHENILKRNAKGNVDLIFIGDSITHQWNREGKDLWKEYYVPRNAVNMGIVGERTEEVLWRLNNGELDGISPKLAVVMIGTNNSSRGDTAEQIADGIKAICAKVRYKLPKTKILLLAIFPRGMGGDNPQRQKNAKASLLASKIADYKMIYYMDIGNIFMNSNGRLTNEFLGDGTHPNEKGYKVWAEAIEPMVVKLMGEDKHSKVQLECPYELAGESFLPVITVKQCITRRYGFRYENDLAAVELKEIAQLNLYIRL